MLRSIKQTAIKTAATGIITLTALELTTHLPTQGRSSEIYHKFSDEIVVPLLRFGLNPEHAHNAALYSLRYNLAPTFRPCVQERYKEVDLSYKISCRNKKLTFHNCIGLAAGFDKDGVAIRPLFDVGFGFIEIGSVTPLPQEGNPKPRMWRLTEDRGVINRYGINSAGADAVKENLSLYRLEARQEEEERIREAVYNGLMDRLTGMAWGACKTLLQTWTGSTWKQKPSEGIIGVNLGRNKIHGDEESSIRDYIQGIHKLGPCADYIVINLSCPNIPGARDLQQPDAIPNLLRSVLRARDETTSSLPLFIKISPDLTPREMNAIANAMKKYPVDGIVISNTTEKRPHTLQSKHKKEKGGLSGAPLRALSTECIRTMYKLTDGKIPIIGVGGVASGHDAYEKLKAGASLVQIYSMMVYEGPGAVSRIRRELAEIMLYNGQRCLEDVVGMDHEEIFWRKREERLRGMRAKENVIVDE